MKAKIDNLKHYMLGELSGKIPYRSLLPEIQKSNIGNLRIFTSISLFFLVVMLVLSFEIAPVAANRLLYLVSAAAMGLMAWLSWRVVPQKTALILPMVYGFMAALLVFGTFLGTITSPNSAAASYIALLLTVPLLFTDRPVRMAAFIALMDGYFIYMVIAHKSPAFWAVDLINAVIFGCISMIVSSYMLYIKLQMYVYREDLRCVSETDLLTGLKNRNSFEQNSGSYPPFTAGSVFCIYVDVNGLHEINNAQGHGAGDRMLQFVARQLRLQVRSDSVYRIGGDEFVALGTDTDPEELQRRIRDFEAQVEQEGYHVAIGFDTVPIRELNMHDLVRRAEENMYRAKALFYQNSDRDRRRRTRP